MGGPAPYDASATGLSSALIPRSAMAGGTEAMVGRLRDEAQRAALGPEIEQNLERRGGADRIQIRTVARADRSTPWHKTLRSWPMERRVRPNSS